LPPVEEFRQISSRDDQDFFLENTPLSREELEIIRWRPNLQEYQIERIDQLIAATPEPSDYNLSFPPLTQEEEDKHEEPKKAAPAAPAPRTVYDV
jgi:hypothetical protein